MTLTELPEAGIDGATALDVSEAPALPVRDAPRRPDLRVAPRVSKATYRRRRRLALLAVAGLTAASMFVLVAFHVFAVQASFQLDKLATEHAAEQRRFEMLSEEVATESSADVVTRAARHLGMVFPTNVFQLNAPPAAPSARAGAAGTLPTGPRLKSSLGPG